MGLAVTSGGVGEMGETVGVDVGVGLRGATVGDGGRTVAEAGGVGAVSSPPQAAANTITTARKPTSQPKRSRFFPIPYLD